MIGIGATAAGPIASTDLAILRRYADGELDRRATMEVLDVEYAELLEMMHLADLRLPTVSPERMVEMVEGMDGVLPRP